MGISAGYFFGFLISFLGVCLLRPILGLAQTICLFPLLLVLVLLRFRFCGALIAPVVFSNSPYNLDNVGRYDYLKLVFQSVRGISFELILILMYFYLISLHPVPYTFMVPVHPSFFSWSIRSCTASVALFCEVPYILVHFPNLFSYSSG